MSGMVIMCKQAVGNNTATSMLSMSIASSCDLALKFCLRANSITSPRVLFRLPLIMRTSCAKVGLFWRGSLPSTISRFKSPRVGTRTCRGALFEARIDVPFPEIQRFHDMHVGIDDLETVFHNNLP